MRRWNVACHDKAQDNDSDLLRSTHGLMPSFSMLAGSVIPMDVSVWISDSDSSGSYSLMSGRLFVLASSTALLSNIEFTSFVMP